MRTRFENDACALRALKRARPRAPSQSRVQRRGKCSLRHMIREDLYITVISYKV